MKWLLTLLGLLYVISPYDLFPDLFVGVGWIDDLIILGLLWWYLYVYRKRRYSYEGPGPQGARPYAQDADREKAETRKAGEPKDPYAVLGVSKGASAEEIHEAYRRLANRYHPDKVIHLGHEFRELAEIRFKEIQVAYQELKSK